MATPLERNCWYGMRMFGTWWSLFSKCWLIYIEFMRAKSSTANEEATLPDKLFFFLSLWPAMAFSHIACFSVSTILWNKRCTYFTEGSICWGVPVGPFNFFNILHLSSKWKPYTIVEWSWNACLHISHSQRLNNPWMLLAGLQSTETDL